VCKGQRGKKNRCIAGRLGKVWDERKNAEFDGKMGGRGEKMQRRRNHSRKGKQKKSTYYITDISRPPYAREKKGVAKR